MISKIEKVKNVILKYQDSELVRSSSERIYFFEKISPRLIAGVFPKLANKLETEKPFFLKRWNNAAAGSCILMTDKTIYVKSRLGKFQPNFDKIDWDDIRSINLIDKVLFINNTLFYINAQPYHMVSKKLIKTTVCVTKVFNDLKEIFPNANEDILNQIVNTQLDEISCENLVEKVNEKSFNLFYIDVKHGNNDETDSNFREYKYMKNINIDMTKYLRFYGESSRLSKHLNGYVCTFEERLFKIFPNSVFPSIIITYGGQVVSRSTGDDLFETVKNINAMLSEENFDENTLESRLKLLINQSTKKNNQISSKIGWERIGVYLFNAFLLAIAIFLYRSCH